MTIFILLHNMWTTKLITEHIFLQANVSAKP